MDRGRVLGSMDSAAAGLEGSASGQKEGRSAILEALDDWEAWVDHLGLSTLRPEPQSEHLESPATRLGGDECCGRWCEQRPETG